MGFLSSDIYLIRHNQTTNTNALPFVPPLSTPLAAFKASPRQRNSPLISYSPIYSNLIGSTATWNSYSPLCIRIRVSFVWLQHNKIFTSIDVFDILKVPGTWIYDRLLICLLHSLYQFYCQAHFFLLLVDFGGPSWRWGGFIELLCGFGYSIGVRRTFRHLIPLISLDMQYHPISQYSSINPCTFHHPHTYIHSKCVPKYFQPTLRPR
jgi:hypothetical protein